MTLVEDLLTNGPDESCGKCRWFRAGEAHPVAIGQRRCGFPMPLVPYWAWIEGVNWQRPNDPVKCAVFEACVKLREPEIRVVLDPTMPKDEVRIQGQYNSVTIKNVKLGEE